MALEFPLQFKRQYAGDLDPDKVFETEESLNNYLQDPVRYSGQIVTCNEREGEIFILNNAKSAWISFDINSTPKISQDIIVTTTVGGALNGTTITSGTNFEDIFRTILTPYQTSKFNSFNVTLTPSLLVYEIGQVISIGSGSFTYTNDTDGIAPHNFSIDGIGFSTNVYQSSPIPSLSQTYFRDTPGSVSWTLNALNSKNVSLVPIIFSRVYQWRIFFGATSTTSIVDLAILQQSTLNPSLSKTWSTTSDNSISYNYTYIAYPSSFGSLNNIVLQDSAPILGAFTQLPNLTWTNAYGITNTYCIYRSNATGAFNIGSTITLS